MECFLGFIIFEGINVSNEYIYEKGNRIHVKPWFSWASNVSVVQTLYKFS